MKKSGVAGVQELQNEKAAFRSVDVDKSASHAMTISNRLAVDSTRYSSPELLTPEFLKFKLFSPKSSRIFRRSRRILLPQPASLTNL
jgi:hypothetical protein